MKAQEKEQDIQPAELSYGLRYVAAPRSSTSDIVAEKYKVMINSPVDHLSNDFCDYFIAKGTDSDKKYYAIVYKHKTLPPVAKLDALVKNPITGLNQVVAYGITRLSNNQTEHMVAIVSHYDIHNTLFDYVETKGVLNNRQLDLLIEQIAIAMRKLSALGIFNYNISPSNILISGDEQFTLREFIDCYPNYYQPEHLLAAELIDCYPASRGTRNTKSDIYALGITVYYAFSGKQPWQQFKGKKEFLFNRFEEGTFSILLNRTKMNERFRTFLRYCLHDQTVNRWNENNLADWLVGKSQGNISHESFANKNTISFNEQNYSSLKSIASGIYHNWEKAVKFIKDDKLLKWASHMSLNNDSLEAIREIVEDRGNTPFVAINTLNSYNKIIRLLSIVDPSGPLRQPAMAISGKDINTLIYYLLVHNKRAIAEQVVKCLRENVHDHYQNEDSTGHINKEEQEQVDKYLNLYNPKGLSRSFDRITYSMNPNAACMSKKLNGYYVDNCEDLLIALNESAKKSKGQFSLDRQIVAFVIAKLEINEDIRSPVLNSFPIYAEHPSFKAMGVLSLLEKEASKVPIPHICRALCEDLQDLLKDNIHQKKFREEILGKIEKAANSDETTINSIIDIFANQHRFLNDYNGHFEAQKQIETINEMITRLGSEEILYSNALLVGQKTTVLLSYLLCFIVLVTVIF